MQTHCATERDVTRSFPLRCRCQEVRVDFFLAGGFPMVLIAVFGAIAVISAVRFAMAPQLGRLVHLAVLCVALATAGVAGVAACLRAVSVNVSAHPEWTEVRHLPVGKKAVEYRKRL